MNAACPAIVDSLQISWSKHQSVAGTSLWLRRKRSKRLSRFSLAAGLFVILHVRLSGMAASLKPWRRRNNLTQVDAAALLGVSQPYLSLLEKGARPLTKDLRDRMKAVHGLKSKVSTDDRFRQQLSALGYPPFSHVPPTRARPSPDALLLSVLSQHDADSRVVETLPWLVRHYAGQMNFPWLVRQAKLGSLQNRMGFVLQAAGVATPQLLTAVHDLERARLLEEATLCWDSMPAAAREWVRANRSPLAMYWNVVTTLRPEDAHDAA